MLSHEVRASLDRVLVHPVTSIENIGQGRNSRVYKVVCDDSTNYALKVYFRDESGSRNRLDVEFSSLRFLWDNGVRCIPRPVSANREHLYGIYEYIDGDVISNVSSYYIDHALKFIERLKELRFVDGSETIPEAAEACFSINEALKVIKSRLNRLINTKADGSDHELLEVFLQKGFVPLLENVEADLKGNMDIMSELAAEERVLSPSDFGFHNSLMKRNGEIIYLDFEYFGWDDPAKMISDFLLHPAMELTHELKQRFLTGVLSCFKMPALYERVRAMFPVYGLKWCLILLNEFIPQDLQRRKFAGRLNQTYSDVRLRQLEKSKKMLSGIMAAYKEFPYSAK